MIKYKYIYIYIYIYIYNYVIMYTYNCSKYTYNIYNTDINKNK